MIVCKNCSVELEKDMPACPLCGLPVGDNVPIRANVAGQQNVFTPGQVMSAPERKFTWEIISLVLLAASVTTFVVDYLINKTISWSEVPAAISLIIFFYVSLFAFWQTKMIVQINLIAYGFLCAAFLCIGIESILSLYRSAVIRIEWSLIVAACSTPVIIILLFVHFRMKKGRSLEKTFHI